MRPEHSDLLNSLLIRWHRWSADPMLSTDHPMREFDRIVATLWPYQRIALILEARNLACGAAVWSSVRIRDRFDRIRARSMLHRALTSSHHDWLEDEVVTYNDDGRRIGESNPMAKLTDHEVDLLREMRDERNDDGTRKYTLGFLALRFKIPKSTVSDICSGRRRAQTAAVVKGQ